MYIYTLQNMTYSDRFSTVLHLESCTCSNSICTSSFLRQNRQNHQVATESPATNALHQACHPSGDPELQEPAQQVKQLSDAVTRLAMRDNRHLQ